MRIGIDATPLLGRMSGVGTYTSNLVAALREGFPEDELVATAFTFRGRDELASAVPAGVQVRSRPIPARVLRAVWGAGSLPPIEALTGRLDVFHATNFVMPPARRAAGVLTIHDLAYLRHPSTVAAASLAYRELVPLGIARSEMVCTPSRAVADQVQDAYDVPDDRITVTHLGVDPVWHLVERPGPEWLAAQGLPSDYLLAVGTLEPRKNLPALIAAYRLLIEDEPEVPPLVLAGGAGWGAGLDLVGIPDGRVLLTGHLPLPDLRRLVAGARVLAFPSLDEGFGLPPLEAFACGVPVVANDIPVTREVLGREASFCDATDPAALAATLLDTVATPRGSTESRRQQAAGFTWARCAEETRTAYEVAVSRRSGR